MGVFVFLNFKSNLLALSGVDENFWEIRFELGTRDDT